MFQLLVGREELLAGIELHEDTANGPEVRALVPTKRKENLRAAVLPGVDDGRVVLILVGGIAKVDELYPAASRPQVVSDRLSLRRRRIPSSPEPLGLPREVGLAGWLHRLQQDILGFQVRVRHAEVPMQEHECLHALLREALDILHPKAPEAVTLEEVVEGCPKRLKHQAVKPLLVHEGLVHESATRSSMWVGLADVLEDVSLNLCVLHVALVIANNLDGHLLAVAAPVLRKDDAAKSAVAK
mmetsp:Transcript_78868/g.176400  ORF Transcript_78868/g.176400 Transcript_78868/m.176400 type:complete len:242 (+) Transcript_78868:554-1279(+)